MILCSWNVAGLRACEKKGMYDWYEGFNPDVLCLQETKATEDQLSERLIHPKNHKTIYAVAKKKGYSGVSTWIQKDIHCENKVGFGLERFDSEGRCVITEFDKFLLFNCYFPNGSRDHSRVPYKLDFCREITKKALSLKKMKDKEVIITGDFNTAHHENDLANPKGNQKTTGFLPIERQWMDEFEKKGFVDCFRYFTPDENGHYTWWTYRNNCRERNIGWRIDYFWCTKGMLPRLKGCWHLTDVMGSDHCPIALEILDQ